MNFDFTDEQNMLRDSVAKLVAAKYDFDTRRKALAAAPGWRPDLWAEMGELGLFMAPLPEEMGGLGGTAVDAMVVMEEFGKGLVVEPYVASVVHAGAALRLGGSAAQREAHGARIASGEGIYAVAALEPKSRYDLADVATTARKDGAGYVLSGHKAVVVGAPQADTLLVSARTAGGVRDRAGITLFAVPKSAAGLSTKDFPTVDGFRAADVFLENVAVGADAVIGDVDGALPVLEGAQDEAIAAICAEAVGAMRVAHAQTVEYARTRKQFGATIGSFQVLQHRMVDMFMAVEQSVSMACLAAIRCAEGDALERAKACSAAKTQIGRAGRFVGQNAIQIHGGMGMTEELAVGHYFKRLTIIDSQYGSADWHVKRYAGLGSDRAAA